jgi:hypothetical protein
VEDIPLGALASPTYRRAAAVTKIGVKLREGEVLEYTDEE